MHSPTSYLLHIYIIKLPKCISAVALLLLISWNLQKIFRYRQHLGIIIEVNKEKMVKRKTSGPCEKDYSSGTVATEWKTCLPNQEPYKAQGTAERLNQGILSDKQVFKEQWKHSTVPLDWGWKLVVFEWEISRMEHNTPQREEVNWAPQSEVILARTPNLEIYPETRTQA